MPTERGNGENGDPSESRGGLQKRVPGKRAETHDPRTPAEKRAADAEASRQEGTDRRLTIFKHLHRRRPPPKRGT
jgi:hypothetical protein